MDSKPSPRFTRTEKPTIKDINNDVVPEWASKWRQLGTELNIDEHLLDIIEKDCPNDCRGCCAKMFSEWLARNPAASWEDIFTATESSSQHVHKEVLEAANILCDRYIRNQFIPSVDDWPPYHPKHYTPLTIVHHNGMCSESEIADIAMKTTGVANAQHCNIEEAIKNVANLFASIENITIDPYAILIEGAPGIGKTMLSKEIAVQWANHAILCNKKLLFLLFMRYPQVREIANIQMLVKCFNFDDALTTRVTEWLTKTKGRHLTIVLDGFDEVSKEDKCYSVIDAIITRQVLTHCDVVVTSRPIASSKLHKIVNFRAEVLGFTEDDKQDYINNALEGEIDKIEELNAFMISNPTINSLCYIPLNMSILLCLTNEGIGTLPKTLTNLYKSFIHMTVVHFLNKDKSLPTTSIAQFTDLPPNYFQALKDLSRFAFLALQQDQLVFTLAEVRATCPTLTPANWYGLGLLKSAKYFKSESAGDHESFHFLHYSIQEYMAAYYIASLPDSELLSLLEKTFWNAHYFNTWVMYVGITGGTQFAFNHFLSGNPLQILSKMFSLIFTPKISNTILYDKIKCLQLLRCSLEADYEMLSSVESIFQEKVIDFSNYNLSVNDVRTFAVLLSRLPNKQWEKLNLSGCNIDDNSCEILCEIVHSQRVALKIKTVDLSCNNIHLESLVKVCSVLKLWQVEELSISVDALYDSKTMSAINNFTNNLHKGIGTSALGKVFSGILLCTYMAHQQKMIVACSSNTGYFACCQYSNCTLNDEMIISLKDLLAKKIPIGVGHISFNYNISSCDAGTKSDQLSYYIPKIRLNGFFMHSKGVYLMSNPFVVQYNSCPLHYVFVDYLAAVICHNIRSNTSYLNMLTKTQSDLIMSTLQNTNNLKLIDLSNNNISKEAADDIAAVLSHNNKLQKLYLGGNNLQAAGAIKIAKGLENVSNLTLIDLSNNNISEEAADDIAAVLSHNNKLQELYLDGNNLQATGAIKIAKGLENVSNLTLIDLSNNNISEEAADDIAAVLSHNQGSAHSGRHWSVATTSL